MLASMSMLPFLSWLSSWSKERSCRRASLMSRYMATRRQHSATERRSKWYRRSGSASRGKVARNSFLPEATFEATHSGFGPTRCFSGSAFPGPV